MNHIGEGYHSSRKSLYMQIILDNVLRAGHIQDSYSSSISNQLFSTQRDKIMLSNINLDLSLLHSGHLRIWCAKYPTG